MRKKQEIETPTSCLNKAADDEPIFVLRAKDKLAPLVVRHWVYLAEFFHEAEKCVEAKSLANDMEAWYKKHVGEPLEVSSQKK